MLFTSDCAVTSRASYVLQKVMEHAVLVNMLVCLLTVVNSSLLSLSLSHKSLN